MIPDHMRKELDRADAKLDKIPLTQLDYLGARVADNSSEWGTPAPNMANAEIVTLPRDEQIFEECRYLSIMGPKLRWLIAAARQCEAATGEVVEVGSYRGGSGLALCRVFDTKKVFMVDTFTGIPENDVHAEGHKQGDFSDTSLDKVSAVFHDKGVNNAILVPGDIRSARILWFFNPMKFAFVHIDADIEQSTKTAVDCFMPKLAPGGGMFFDDYGNKRCPGVKPAVDELMQTGRFDMTHVLGTVFLKLRP